MINAFTSFIEEAFQKSKVLLWPFRKDVWLKLFIIYIFTAGCSYPGISFLGGGTQKKDKKSAQAMGSSLNVARTPRRGPLLLVQDKKSHVGKSSHPSPVEPSEKIKSFIAHYKHWAMPLLVGGGFFLGALILFFVWWISRLHIVLVQVLLEGVVQLRNGWKATKDLGNSFFRFNISMILVSLALLALIGVHGYDAFQAAGGKLTWGWGGQMVGLIMFLGGFWMIIYTVFRFLPSVMIIQQHEAIDSLKDIWAWMTHDLYRAAVFVVIYFALALGVNVIVVIVSLIVGLLVGVPTVLITALMAGLVSKIATSASIFLGFTGFLVGMVLVLVFSFVVTVPLRTFFSYLRLEMVQGELKRRSPLPESYPRIDL